MNVNASEAWQIILGIISLVGAANAFFISRLVTKVDEAVRSNESLKQTVAILSSKVDQLTDLQQRVISLEKQVTLLEYIAQKKSEFTPKEEG